MFSGLIEIGCRKLAIIEINERNGSKWISDSACSVEDEHEYKSNFPESVSSNDRFHDTFVQENSHEHLKNVGLVYLSINSLRDRFNF